MGSVFKPAMDAEHRSTAVAAVVKRLSKAPITEEERTLIAACYAHAYRGSSARRFLADMSHASEMTDSQRRWLWRLVWRHRRWFSIRIRTAAFQSYGWAFGDWRGPAALPPSAGVSEHEQPTLLP